MINPQPLLFFAVAIFVAEMANPYILCPVWGVAHPWLEWLIRG